MSRCHDLLSRARTLYDDPRSGLATAAAEAARGGFSGGAEWMRRALGAVRGRAPSGRMDFRALGLRKYGLATAGAAVAAAGSFVLHAPPLVLLIAAGIGFYVVESRFAFAFPLALDGHPRPLVASRRTLRSTEGALRSLATTTGIAFTMLAFGFAGRGFLRSWCIGCLAVVLWYEQARCARGVAA